MGYCMTAAFSGQESGVCRECALLHHRSMKELLTCRLAVISRRVGPAKLASRLRSPVSRHEFRGTASFIALLSALKGSGMHKPKQQLEVLAVLENNMPQNKTVRMAPPFLTESSQRSFTGG